MSEEATQDIGSQEVAAPVANAPMAAQEAAASPVSFLDSLPEDLRAEPSLKNFSDPAALAKSYVHAQRMIGADKIPLPGKSATDDEWRAVYKRLGAPDDPQEYKVEFSDDILSSQESSSFRSAAFEAGLNQRQVERMSQFISQSISEARNGLEQKVDEARYNGEQELRQEWGQAFDQKIEMAYKAANTFLGDTELLDTVQLADGRLLGDHPAVVKMFAKLASEIGEDKLIGDTTELVMTPADAQRQIDEVTRQGTPYWDKFHPEHRQYVEEALRLREYL